MRAERILLVLGVAALVSAPCVARAQAPRAKAPAARAPAVKTPASPRAPVDVQLGTAIQPETVTVGQHFTATVRVRVPAGATLRFQMHPDSGARVDTAAATTRTDAHATGYDESTVRYVLAAWDTGAVPIGLDDVVVVTSAGERMIPLTGLGVTVRSVLPADTTKRVPKPPRDRVVVSAFDWLPWLIALGVLALIALLAWLAWKWRQRRRAPLTPHEWAQRELARLAETGWETSDPARYAIAVTDVLREYLTRSFPAVRRSETTRELADSLANVTAVPRTRTVALLEGIDLVKFARRGMKPEDARATAATVREILAATEQRLDEERAAAEQARKARKAA